MSLVFADISCNLALPCNPSAATALGPALSTKLAVHYPNDAEHDLYLCPAGERLAFHRIQKLGNSVRTHLYKAPRAACHRCKLRAQCGPKKCDLAKGGLSRAAKILLLHPFKAKMETESAKQLYRQRSRIAEFPHAWIKERCGLRQFRCRGRSKISMEAIWACLSYNIVRWFSIRRKINATATA
jgi:hypothetical protein